MPDSTPRSERRRRRRVSAAAVVSACALALGAGPIPAALADGDPASDVLAAQPLFLPADGGFGATEQAQFGRLLSSAQRQGYDIRVAVIATPSDLGSVSALWGNPRGYARFLGDELSQIYHGTLLVVMPDGFGVADVGGPPAAGDREAASLPAAARGTSMVAAAESSVQRLAAAAGHRLALPTATAGSSPSSGLGSSLGTVDAGSWLALAAGAALIAAAWTASLRARPPTRRLNG